jgi:UDP-N-acetylmuramyl tripeptide synthase
VSYFGIESLGHQPAHRIEASPEHASDVKACPRCAGPIHYTAIFFGHLGHYACSACGFSRPNPQVKAARVELDGVGGSRFQLISEEGEATLRFPLPGLYNIYNALGAATGAMDLDLELGLIARTLEMVTPAFGRMERLLVENRDTYLALAKNPPGLNEVIRTLVAGGEPLHLLVMLNDNTADGRDVSWIWDADVEMLQGRVAAAVFAGTRAEDMALRFKYAAVIGAEDGPRWEVRSDTRRALEDAIRLTPEGRRLFIVPTYTALLDVRNTLTRLGYVRPYWEE